LVAVATHTIGLSHVFFKKSAIMDVPLKHAMLQPSEPDPRPVHAVRIQIFHPESF
jgi:hypothetical protein